jgi:hypothetical protein
LPSACGDGSEGCRSAGGRKMLDTVLWCVLWVVPPALAAAWIVVFLGVRGDLRVWRTKKDFGFDELDTLLESQENKYQVSKYLHKYKSDRRSYENRIAKSVVFLVAAALIVLADSVILILRLAF